MWDVELDTASEERRKANEWQVLYFYLRDEIDNKWVPKFRHGLAWGFLAGFIAGVICFAVELKIM